MENAGGQPQKVWLDKSAHQQLGQLWRKVFFSPALTGNRYQKLAYVMGPPGAKGAVHTHLGEEVVFTIQGRCVLTIQGKEHLLEPDTAFLIPPDVEHPAQVIGDEPWIAVAAYCDDCPVLQRLRNATG
jgi:quercetin dioxygenase-like cupin family protein